MKPKSQMPFISLAAISHASQPYPTVGMWSTRPERIAIDVSRMGNSDYEFCVALHEMIEAYLCLRKGVTDQGVTDFDVAFEKDREAGKHSQTAEPGDSKQAPYFSEHKFATKIERLMAKQLRVNWTKYEKAINALP